MTMTNPSTAYLEWDTADRIRKAMRVRDIGNQELADALYVSRNTISNWLGGRTTPDGPALLGLASVLDVPLEWLKTGTAPSEDEAVESRPWESNPRPSHYKRKGSYPIVGAGAYALAYCLVRELLEGAR